jgi:hypothetical protein
LTAAFLAEERYKAAAAVANKERIPGDSPLAGALHALIAQAFEKMTIAVAVLNRQIMVFPRGDLPHAASESA